MEIDQGKLQRLKCSVKNHDWGRPARNSTVARLFFHNSRSGNRTRTRRSPLNLEPEPNKPYAEFWIGTHDSGPSFLISGDENETLKSWLSRNPHVLGFNVLQRWGSDLPFLIKVVSVAKALPIQAHHQRGMALALTEFEALCGFISSEAMVDNVPEIWNLIVFGKEISALNHAEHQCSSMFTKIMSADKHKVTKAVDKLKRRLTNARQWRDLTVQEELALRLEEQHPGDVGVIAPFFLNYVKLKPGEAISIRPNELHAYISGECIECMTNSQHRDTQTLWRGPPEIMRANFLCPHMTEYRPPFMELVINRFVLLNPGETLVIAPVPTPSIFLVTDGAALIDVGGTDNFFGIMEGDVIFVAAHTKVPIRQPITLILFRFALCVTP